ncbi:transcriptional regulator [Longispora fulva]|uniref:Transcriptional regulator with XRE-family HTH domain n=1 Tax=Longispora fulva TaxID=619741 RepID=A0A8J7KQE4_9ACTN|nr:helix-turn-helix transcriptional regulator [Longispora fulva]MBG6137307.1 transcriptional regulator with XRE-family HTH domain [Longispora fulva]GIG61338.1 transcriptional regulator [Longispora fulva]
MPSPYVRRLRLATEIRELRKAAGLTSEALARLIVGGSRLKISRLETSARKPDIGDVMKVLEALGVEAGSDRWMDLVKVARDGAERGWWERPAFTGMGPRQALWADLEAGATSIRMYEPAAVPGVLQTEGFIRARNETMAATDGHAFDPVATANGRLRRQQEVFRPGGPTLDVILEEQSLRRLAVPPATMGEQLGHLARMCEHPQVTIRVLPIEIDVISVYVPRGPYNLFSFSDPNDPVVLLADNLTADVVSGDADEVAPYAQLFERLTEGALSPSRSAAHIASLAKAGA